MNLVHLKYAAVVAEQKSMTKAAELLFTAQPNLSRAIRELESGIGITIFRRTSKGIFPTPEGEEFLGYAKKVLAEVDALESMYRDRGKETARFSISVPRASYISCAFTEFVNRLPDGGAAEIFYKETNSQRAIENIVESDYRLGILRYQSGYEANFKKLLGEKELSGETVCEFRYVLLMSERHPLAQKKAIEIADLSPFTEIAHADPFVPSLPLSAVRKNEMLDNVARHIYVFERGSQMDLLSCSRQAFMWVSPVPERILRRYSLVQRECAENDRLYRDLLIRKRGYTLTALDKSFIDELMRVRDEIAV